MKWDDPNAVMRWCGWVVKRFTGMGQSTESYEDAHSKCLAEVYRHLKYTSTPRQDILIKCCIRVMMETKDEPNHSEELDNVCVEHEDFNLIDNDIDNKDYLDKIKNILTEKEYKLLMDYFTNKLKDMGDQLGITRQGVGQRVNRLIKKIKNELL